jgi:hypothetical protein
MNVISNFSRSSDSNILYYRLVGFWTSSIIWCLKKEFFENGICLQDFVFFFQDMKTTGKVRNQVFLNEYIILSSPREATFTDTVHMV